ncbi:hypothetical protein [Streptomyces sp. B3I8]|uniref:hypothetical protein n=1 Tax=Streptomyces sp. B3I8 TaxID=3042303 RepID=UPI0027D7C523|nr:hypothetical protein [Streptomyces sp. B3I8]
MSDSWTTVVPLDYDATNAPQVGPVTTHTATGSTTRGFPQFFLDSGGPSRRRRAAALSQGVNALLELVNGVAGWLVD